MNKLAISVVIPVYNAEDYVANAVESALDQPEVAEVILVEDGSPDDALAVCRDLGKKYERVNVFQHPGGENRGAGASRNLGIKKSTCPFISFLDADDWYLQNRFKTTAKIFQENPDADGVYDAVGTHFENDEARKKWFRFRDYTVSAPRFRVGPDELLFNFLLDASGHFCTDGIIVKRSIFDKTGLFDTELEISQDTHMWIRMAAVANLYPGKLETPVAMRRVHADNRWTTNDAKRAKFAQMYWRKLDGWAADENLSVRKRGAMRCAKLIYEAKGDNPNFGLTAAIKFIGLLFRSFISNPLITIAVIPAFLRRLKAEIRKKLV